MYENVWNLGVPTGCTFDGLFPLQWFDFPRNIAIDERIGLPRRLRRTLSRFHFRSDFCVFFIDFY